MKGRNFVRSKKTEIKAEEALTFLPTGQKAIPIEGESVLETALRCGVEVYHSCGGMGSCTTCRVYIESGLELLPEKTESEMERAEERVFAENERLSCQIPSIKGLVLKLP